MKRLYRIMIIILLLCGCGAQSEKDISSGKDEGKVTLRNELAQLDLKLLKEKIDNGDTFVFMVTQSTCSYCNAMKRTVVPFIREHSDLPFFEIEVDMLGTKKSDINENFNKLKQFVPEYEGTTPEVFYMDKGKLQQHTSGDMDETALYNFFIDCGLIHGEKREAVQIDTEVHSNTYMKEIDYVECSEMLETKKSFYLYIAENDRYNAMLSDKLMNYTEKNKTTIYVLNLSKVEQPATEDEYDKLERAMKITQERVKDVFQYTPEIFSIKDGKVIDSLTDNVTDKELMKWFQKQ